MRTYHKGLHILSSKLHSHFPEQQKKRQILKQVDI